MTAQMSALAAAQSLVAEAHSVVVFSGAGMSADSRVPTFRDSLTGLWATYDPAELATPQAWHAHRDLVWTWYAARAAGVRDALPNAGHMAVAELGAVKNVTVVTQNVDDLHERAGSDRVLHLHGSLFAPRCERCEMPHEMPLLTEGISRERRIPPPPCIRCGAAVRPGVVWFGEALPDAVWARAVDVIDDADVVIVVGTSGLVYPAAMLPQRAVEAGATVIEVNPDPSGVAGCAAVSVAMTAALALPRLLPVAG